MSEIEFEKWFPHVLYSAALESQQLALNPELSLWHVAYREIDSHAIFLFDCFAEDSAHAIEQAENAYPDTIIVSTEKINNQLNWQTSLHRINQRLRRLNTSVPAEDLQRARDLLSNLMFKGEKTCN